MTSHKQISLFTEESLTSSQEVFPASPTAWPENEKAKPMSAIYGLRCYEQYEKFPRATSWGKTFLALLIGTGDWYSTRCRLIWSLRVTRSRPWLYLRRRSMPRTEGIGSGLLLKTPCTADAYSENLAKQEQVFGNSGTLAQEIQSGFVEQRWPGLLPTIADNLADQFAQTGTSSQLNPRFVAEMMGFPVNWTELPFLSGGTNQFGPTEMQ